MAVNNEIWLDLEVRHFCDFEPDEALDISVLYHRMNVSWMFYDDYIADRHPGIKRFPKFAVFVSAAIDNISSLQFLVPQKDQIIEQLNQYRSSIPRSGCILINPSLDKVLLVKSFNSTSYIITAGKINEGETPLEAAIREVKEETDYDVSSLINPDNMLQANTNGHTVYLFVVTGVVEKYNFQPNTRKEIQDFKWFPINQNDWSQTHFMKPFLPQLLPLIQNLRNKKKNKKRRESTG